MSEHENVEYVTCPYCRQLNVLYNVEPAKNCPQKCDECGRDFLYDVVMDAKFTVYTGSSLQEGADK